MVWSAPEAAALALLLLPFVASGVGKALDFRAAAAEVASLGLPAPRAVAAGTVALQLAAPAAVLLSASLAPAAALALALFTLAATLIGHGFWRWPSGSAERLRDRTAFLEHLGLAGALLFVAVAA